MRIAIQSQNNEEHFHLPHQGLWFVLLLLVMLLLLSKDVAAGGSPIVDRRLSTVVGASDDGRN